MSWKREQYTYRDGGGRYGVVDGVVVILGGHCDLYCGGSCQSRCPPVRYFHHKCVSTRTRTKDNDSLLWMIHQLYCLMALHNGLITE